MEKEILMMAFETLKNDVSTLRQEVKELKEQILIKGKSENTQPITAISVNELDVLLTTKEVQEILGVCYNTLQSSIVKKGLLVPKRVSKRKIRYSKRELQAYIMNLNNNFKEGTENE